MSKFHRLKVSDVRRETEDTVSIAFQVPDDLRADYSFMPGQYLTLKADLGGEDVRRTYSICSAANEFQGGAGELRVAVKRVDGGLFSSYANENISAGDEIEVMVPDGRFTVSPDPAASKTYVAFASGSGITPVMSMIKTVLAAEPDSSFTLFYGNRSTGSIIFRDALEDLKDRYHDRFTLVHVFSREFQEAPLFNGRLDTDRAGQLLDALVELGDVDKFLICGPGSMIADVTAALEQRDVPKDKIGFEMFTPADGSSPLAKPASVGAADGAGDSDVAELAAPGAEAEVTVVIDGARTKFALAGDGDNIMQAARDQGADAPFSCTGGVCASCRARLKEGRVEMDVNFALSDEELAQGYILTCQSHPRTTRVVVDYDDAV
ncbi:phenylacetate-CoA oxygenase/reductase subunit PaaK [Hwanghaeella grinnelliae]|uniref:Phenylacetate-CoA oxygenase/reductase subunit PaaK n=1 Tax=Hwanghaeella grinnelliae TaxID=2500179 RepID=A0A3S2W6X0_9PROT|nr:1,2-phenylacetyl-CoA epoxidase subunit PaaE [Hwanghaeella grinnelliae]RVU38741.1 phenylacetate-CoA oxygenase/reductase subunit PaaK [Hwanghaeella grinnelliae]